MVPKKIFPFVLVLTLSIVRGHAEAPSASNSATEPPPIPVEELSRSYAEKEKEFKIARAIYTYRQDVKVQELNGDDRVTGEFNLVSDIIFDSTGKRTEKIVRAPAPTLKKIGMTAEDMQDLREIQPFVLTSDDINKYNLKDAVKEKVDEINGYASDVSP